MFDRMQGLGGVANRAARLQATEDTLDLVDLPEASLHRYPHECSPGSTPAPGNRARPCAAAETHIILDGPVSAVDVSVQAQTSTR